LVSLDNKHFFPLEFLKPTYDANSLTASQSKLKAKGGKAQLMKEDEGDNPQDEDHKIEVEEQDEDG
jgi:hypothetical protein